MDLKHASDIPEYDSRVADIMLSISMERPGNPMESQSKRVVPQYLAEQKIPTKLFETEVDHLGGQLQSKGGQSQGKATMNRHVIVAGQLQDKKKKDVNFTNFPGYRAKELAELPGQLEAPQLLHRVTQAQDFDTGFAKFWKKIFLSEASIAVVHDLFWWTFMKIFKPGTQTDQDQVFDRLADSFAALFFSIHPDTRDKIFKVYPGVLAQAIYMIFHDAFPESHRMFGPLFKEEVVGYCWELTTGTKPPPRTWNEWDLEGLQGKSGENFDSKQLAIMPVTRN
ncbi:FAM227B [Bugula neritina]|uniref:FAM227B n=1 Tax=Bugula neritina TaxID=10212 RepID=A0A7J7KGN1_BUGNE|nr:FAM227B [Bugula neritina]